METWEYGRAGLVMTTKINVRSHKLWEHGDRIRGSDHGHRVLLHEVEPFRIPAFRLSDKLSRLWDKAFSQIRGRYLQRGTPTKTRLVAHATTPCTNSKVLTVCQPTAKIQDHAEVLFEGKYRPVSAVLSLSLNANSISS